MRRSGSNWPAELLAARPKRLRSLIFNAPGKLRRHARRTILRLTQSLSRFGNWQGAIRLLPFGLTPESSSWRLD
jgi:hypothetical protein